MVNPKKPNRRKKKRSYRKLRKSKHSPEDMKLPAVIAAERRERSNYFPDRGAEIRFRQKQVFLEALRVKLGAITLACEAVNIPYKDVMQWIEEDPEFDEAVKFVQSREIVDIAEHALYKKVKMGDTAAITTVLYNLASDKWKNPNKEKQAPPSTPTELSDKDRAILEEAGIKPLAERFREGIVKDAAKPKKQ